MDIVLEISDYYLFDRVYAYLFPKSIAIPQSITNTFSKFSPISELNSSSSALISYSNKFFNFNNGIPGDCPREIYGLLPNLLPENEYMYASILPRSNIFRLVLSLFLIMSVFGWLLYFIVAYISYLTVFDTNIFNHPRYLKNQISLEIKQASSAIPVMVMLTVPWFVFELKGYSKLYLNIDQSTGGWTAVFWQVPSFIMFTDCGIYFIHRWLHWPSVYKVLHKPHHKWIVCTPFASHAFHPVDGYAQSLPYHIFPFIFPLHKISYLLLFTFVNFWTVMIHDGQYLSNDPFVNGTACHTIHHLYFNYNYGQFTTLWDRLGNSYRRPDDSLFDRKAKNDKSTWKKQTQQMEAIRGELEGNDDDRIYIQDEIAKKDI